MRLTNHISVLSALTVGARSRKGAAQPPTTALQLSFSLVCIFVFRFTEMARNFSENAFSILEEMHFHYITHYAKGVYSVRNGSLATVERNFSAVELRYYYSLYFYPRAGGDQYYRALPAGPYD